MNPWHDFDPGRITPERFLAVIEIPKGSKKKYELDKESGLLILNRILFTSTHYPANYGFIPRTLSQDGDPLDVLVLCTEALEPLTLVECFPIGVVSMEDEKEMDEKIIAVPASDPVYSSYRDIRELPPHIVQEMAHFFEVYKELEHLKTSIKTVANRDQALALIARYLAAYSAAYPSKRARASSLSAANPSPTRP